MSSQASVSTAVSLDSSQPSQPVSEPLPASFSVLRESRWTPQPSVVRPLPGHCRTALPLAALVAYGSGDPSSSAMKPLGVVEPWQKVDAKADMQAVWETYEDVFYGDYQPLPSTHRR